MSSSSVLESFTAAEKEALSKFKVDYLERAIKETAQQTSSSVTSLEIWGVPIAMNDDPRIDVIIVKFLRAK